MPITFDEAVQTALSNLQSLSNEIAQYDKTISDFYHLFEFGDFPDDVLLEIHRRFTDALCKRRICKNRLAIAQGIENKTISQRYYIPRILTDDFVQYRKYLKIE